MTELDHRRFLRHFLPAESVLRAYLLAATGDMHAADDLLQEVSSVLCEKFGEYDEERPFRAWAMGVARLEVLKWRQRLARSRETLSVETLGVLADAAEEHAGEIDERLLHLRHCVEALRERIREVLRLRYWQALPIRQVAERLGRSVAAIEMTLVRARRGLRRCVEKRLAKAGEAP
jgi:RNA polymerase sigma-70 factor (ECF subfamily)